MATRPKARTEASPFVQLDYLYTPSSDVAADARYFTEVLGGRLAFSIEGMGTRVAKVDLTDGPPHILLTDHLEGDRPVFIYRVADLDEAMRELKKRGWKINRRWRYRWGRAARSPFRRAIASPSTN
jgi:hypothetical protein